MTLVLDASVALSWLQLPSQTPVGKRSRYWKA